MLTHGKIGFLHLVRLTSYKQLFKTVTNSSRHAEFISSSYCLHSFSVFPIGNTPFVHIVYSSTTHVNGYSFRFSFRKSAKKTIVVQDSYKLKNRSFILIHIFFTTVPMVFRCSIHDIFLIILSFYLCSKKFLDKFLRGGG